VLEIEPEFVEAGVGVARTYALEGADRAARVEMLRAAGRGYTVSLMMRKKELGKYFKEHELRLLEADRPTLTTSRDPFANPLHKKELVPPGPGESGPKKLLPLEVQDQIVASAQAAFERGMSAVSRGEIDLAVTEYNKVIELYKTKEYFTDEKLTAALEEIYQRAKKRMYPGIQVALRRRTLARAGELVRELTAAVSRRDMNEARRLNAEFVKLADAADTGNDSELKNVKPRLTVSGTITGRLTQGRPVAFLEVTTQDGVRKLAVSASDSVEILGEFTVTAIGEDEVTACYRSIEVRVQVGRARQETGTVRP
jgi:hypothetical protein